MKNSVKEKVEKSGTEKKRELKFIALTRNLSKRVSKSVAEFGNSFFSKYSDMLGEEIGRGAAGKAVQIKHFAISICLSLLAIFLSATEMGQDAYPLSIAILCAAGSKRRADFFSPKLIIALSLGAVIISTMMMKTAGVLYFAVFLALFILRSILTSAEYDERLAFRVITSVFTSVIIGGVLTLISDFSLLSLVSFATLMTTTPIFTYLFASLYDMIGLKSVETKDAERLGAGVLAIVFCTLFSLSELHFLGLSVSALTAFCSSIVISKKYGPTEGALTGLVLGAACGSPVYSAVFGVNAYLSGLFFPSDLYALLVSVPVSASLSVFLGGSSGFLMIMPEIMAAFLILWPLLSRIEANRGKISSQPLRQAFLSRGSIGKSLEKMSGTFSSLSEVFFAASEGFKPLKPEDIHSFVESACNGVCASCSSSVMCWGKKWSDTNGVLSAISETVVKKDRVELDDFPEYFRARCVKIEELCGAVNRSIAGYCYDKGSSGRVNMIAGEYKTVSKLLKSTAEKFAHSPEKDEEMAKKVSSLLEKLGIPYGFVEVWGGRNTVVDAVGVFPEKIPYSTLDLISAFENVCGISFEEPEFISAGNDSVMRLVRRRAIRLECAKNTCAKRGESANGDTVSFFESDAGMFYSLICDGMGSGREAALTSRLASVFLEKLLSCMSDKGVTVEMLNRMLISKNGESFTTVDLAEVDLYEKCAVFMKAGAPSSYILRDGKVYKINSKTPPAGIIDDFCAEETRVKVQSGDIIVLFSDGVLDDSESFGMSDIILKNASLSAAELSREILSAALARFSAQDDMSVAVIKVYSN